MIDGVTNADAIPVLERLLQFSGQRHRMITNNIANASTPGFRPSDLPVAQFQRQLGEAIDERRTRHGAAGGALLPRDAAGIEFRQDGMVIESQPLAENLMFHDGNDRDVERMMQDLVENFMTFRLAADFARSRFDLLNSAISERV